MWARNKYKGMDVKNKQMETQRDGVMYWSKGGVKGPVGVRNSNNGKR